MRFVDGEALSRTTCCPREFACLEDYDRSRCPAVERRPDGVVLEVCAHGSCPYAKATSETKICTCPTRAVLHERYQM